MSTDPVLQTLQVLGLDSMFQKFQILPEIELPGIDAWHFLPEDFPISFCPDIPEYLNYDFQSNWFRQHRVHNHDIIKA